MTSFKPLRTTDYNGGEPSDTAHLNPNLTEPILASFPCNLPTGDILKKIPFNLYQSEKPSKKGVRRVIKAEHKGIKYEAKSYSAEMCERDQASDYYVAVFDSKDNKAYTIPIKGAY
jgi:A49-like RNA polymerase I associated factor